ncbi:MAG: hypothetical protein Q8R91_05695 [Candidatus Omnitrophota bacterium]|nr:hypothetical protein [Candidatus Omnitrophota bacterium]
MSLIRMTLQSWVELTFLIGITGSILLGAFRPELRPLSRSIATLLFLVWGMLAMRGWLTATVEHRFLLMLDSKLEEGKIGIPVSVSLSSRGGFICQNPIDVRLVIEDITPPNGVPTTEMHEGRKKFADAFKELDVIWFGSKEFPFKRGGLLPREPQAGYVGVKNGFCKGKSNIVFTTPGEHEIHVRTVRTDNRENISRVKKEDVQDSVIHVSPPEVVQEIRIGNLTYGLSLLVLALSIWQVLGEVWK